MSRPISIDKASRPAEHNTIILPDVDDRADLERLVVDVEALNEGALHIEYAYQPIPSRPDIDVQAPPTWQAGWYPNGDIPA